MNVLIRTTTLALLVLMAPAAALAGDEKAKEYYQKAVSHWGDPDAEQALAYAAKALEHAESKTMRLNVLYMIGQLHQGKTGDFEEALAAYDRIIFSTVGVDVLAQRQVRAMALLGKGTILYSERDDVEAALAAYQASHQNYPSAQNADTLSQLLFRIGRDPEKSERAQTEQLTSALKLAEEAVTRDERATRRNPAQTAKYQLQLVIVLRALGQVERADEVWKGVDEDALEPSSLYQRAILMALQGHAAEDVASPLRYSLEIRPAARARNQLRKFIRTEPDFRSYRADPAWAPLVEDEPADE